jgi:hypothetical protein
MSNLAAATRTHSPLTMAMAAAVAVATACGSEGGSRPSTVTSPSPSPSVFPGFGQCHVTLTSFCGGSCPDYATVVDRLQRGCATAPLRSRALAGHCPGVFYYTLSEGPFSSSSAYFDGNGVMIGARAGTDYNAYCNGASFDIDAGVILTCPRPLELEQLCVR